MYNKTVYVCTNILGDNNDRYIKLLGLLYVIDTIKKLYHNKTVLLIASIIKYKLYVYGNSVLLMVGFY